jgi:hypothetical protein
MPPNARKTLSLSATVSLVVHYAEKSVHRSGCVLQIGFTVGKNATAFSVVRAVRWSGWLTHLVQPRCITTIRTLTIG